MTADATEALARALTDWADPMIGEADPVYRLAAAEIVKALAILGYEVRPIEPTRAGQACADCGQVWPNVDDHNDHPFRPIEQAGSLPASGEALNSPKGSQVGAETPRAAVHAGLDTPGTHGGSVKPAIEQASVRPASPDPAKAADEMGGHFGPCCYGSNHQAAEAVDREAAGGEPSGERIVDPDRAIPSAAVAPLEPIPTNWGVGPLTHPAAVADRWRGHPSPIRDEPAVLLRDTDEDRERLAAALTSVEWHRWKSERVDDIHTRNLSNAIIAALRDK